RDSVAWVTSIPSAASMRASSVWLRIALVETSSTMRAWRATRVVAAEWVIVAPPTTLACSTWCSSCGRSRIEGRRDRGQERLGLVLAQDQRRGEPHRVRADRVHQKARLLSRFGDCTGRRLGQLDADEQARTANLRDERVDRKSTRLNSS